MLSDMDFPNGKIYGRLTKTKSTYQSKNASAEFGKTVGTTN